MGILGGATKRMIEEAFAEETDDCLIWPFSLDAKGYPQAMDAHGFYKPHRRICEMAYGAPPSPKHHAAHLCGIRACLNKRHLEWSTPFENAQHKFMHGTGYRGKRTLNDQQVIDIRTRWRNGAMMKDLAAEYGLTANPVSKIVKFRTYRDVA